MSNSWDKDFHEEIEKGFKDDMHNLPRNFVLLDTEKSGGTKCMECHLWGCGANYMDEAVFIKWINDVSKKHDTSIGVMYTENGSEPRTFTTQGR